MKPVVQSRTGKDGRCFAACIASLLEIKEAEVPEWVHEDTINAWLIPEHGLEFKEMPIDDVALAPVGWHLIEGVSPRGGQHAVVGRDGRFVFDPHPQDGTGRGLVDKQRYGLLLPAKRERATDRADMMALRRNTERQGGPFFIQTTSQSGKERTGPIRRSFPISKQGEK